MVVSKKFEELLKSKKFLKAKEFILEYEKELQTTQNKYLINKIRETAQEMRQMYQNDFSFIDFKEKFDKDQLYFEKGANIPINKKFYECFEKNYCSFDKINCVEAVLENCLNSKFEILSENVITIKNCNNLVLSGKTKQLRLNNCRNIILEVFVESGIVLENSNNINIKRFENNNFSVKDFSSLESEKNYFFSK